MSVKPILFNTEMTRAILDGRKTTTRRIIKPQPQADADMMFCFAGSCKKDIFRWHDRKNDAHFTPPCCGDDVLWVRETWCELARVDADGYTHYDDCQYYYATDGDYQIDLYDASGFLLDDQKLKWHPSIHMPREAARLFLRVTSVRAERLLDMTVDDAIAEGINTDGIITSEGPIEYRVWNRMKELWDGTIKPTDLDKYGWDTNPWVWVIEFERTEKPEGWCTHEQP